MDTTVTALYDGHVLTPEGPVSLKPDQRYRITIHVPEDVDEKDAWSVLDDIDGVADMPEDWSQEHDHYIHGTPKRDGQP